MKAKKKLKIVAIVLGGIFVIINIVWFATVYRQWHNYEVNSGAVKSDDLPETRYLSDGDKYSVVISKPSYLRFDKGGFLKVIFSEPYTITDAKTDHPTANRDVNVTLFFWPDMSGEFHCGVMFNDGIKSKMYQVYLDKDLNIVSNENVIEDEATEEIKELVENNRKTIEEMYQFGIDSFGLDKDKHREGKYQ